VEASYASVAVPIPVRRLFTYRVAESLLDQIEVGARVRVPFGPRRLLGTVVAWPAPEPDEGVEIKSIDSVLQDPRRRLTPRVLELTRFLADYYLCSWGEAIEAALPPEPGPAPRPDHVRRLPAADADALPAQAVAQRRLLSALPPDGTPVPLAGLDASGRRAVAALRKQGQLELVRSDTERDEAPPAAPGPTAAPYPLTPGQRAVLEQLAPSLASREYAPWLLFGATGSGKTEVYFQAAHEVLRQGRGVIHLVPEIGLTPMLVDKVRRRFPGQATVLHSGLSKGARLAAWDSLRTGRKRFVVGTRSAIFAPVGDLGLIVVDEEQDGSYKQAETPRYNGRDLAVVRAKAEGAVLVLGSATPSMESFRHARAGRYGLLDLGPRIDRRPLPEVRRVDMRDEYRRRGEVGPVSEELLEALRERIARGEQALILRNRRGWAAVVLCPTCGYRVSCERCSISLTWHRADRRLRCHYCGFELPFPERCPTCNGEELKQMGEGTERVEDIVRAHVPEARVARMDRDALRRRGAHTELLRRFEARQIDVLVGTQMIAKGHDFHNVTLVGVLSADHSLGLPDFRAAERTFQLLTQVAGRAGRGTKPGEVIVQAFAPDHPLLELAARQDFIGFYDRELRYRQALKFPPITAVVQLLVLDKELHQAAEWARTLAQAVRDAGGDRLLMSGPGAAPVERIKGRYRQQILVRSAGRRRLVEAVDRALSAVEGAVPRRAIQVDVDPVTMT